MIDEYQNASPLILNQIMKKLENIKSKIEIDLLDTDIAEDTCKNDNMQQEITPVTLITILKKVEDIEGIWEKKVAFLKVEEAVAEFYHQHVNKTKAPKTYDSVINSFQRNFQKLNVADITAEECEQFLLDHWGDYSKNTLIQNHRLLKAFFNWCIKYLKKKGQPLFYNPCELISFGSQRYKDVEFLPIEIIREIIKAGALTKTGELKENRRLMMLVMATSGMRPGEVCNLINSDINGQVITIRDPKSRRYNMEIYNEYAVIPESVAHDLTIFLKVKQNADRVFMSYNYFMDPKKGIISQLRKGIPGFTPTYFRRWVAHYWNEKGDEGMVKFVLRYNSKMNEDHFDPLIKKMLEVKCVPPCSVEAACEKITQLERDILSK